MLETRTASHPSFPSHRQAPAVPISSFQQQKSAFLRQPITILIDQQKMLLHSHTEQPTLTAGNYKFFPRQLLGKGSTGSVYRGLHAKTNLPVAVKVVELAKINDEATRSLLENEKTALRAVSGPFVVKLEQIVEERGFCYIVTELCEGWTLSEYLKRQVMLGEREAMSIFQKLVAGCLTLQQQCVIHRDLKPANVMVDGKGKVKIIDLGYCQIIMAKKVMKTFNVGSPSYMSPEAYHRTLYSEKSDGWALGMTLYEMLHGETLDKNLETGKYFEQLKNGALLESKLSQLVSAQVREIIRSALRYMPEERASLSNLKYQADCYHIRQNEKNLRVANGFRETVGTLRKGEVSSLRNLEPVKLDTENSSSGKGFVSFQNFSKTLANFKSAGTAMQHKTSLEEFDGGSMRQSADKSRKVGVDQKLERFMQTVVKKPDVVKSNNSSQMALECRPALSARDIELFHRTQAPPLPMRRQVTVRYV